MVEFKVFCKNKLFGKFFRNQSLLDLIIKYLLFF